MQVFLYSFQLAASARTPVDEAFRNDQLEVHTLQPSKSLGDLSVPVSATCFICSAVLAGDVSCFEPEGPSWKGW